MKPIVFSMIALFFLTFISAIIMFVRRVHGVRSQSLSMKYFKTYDVDDAATLQSKEFQHMRQADRHYINLFELPILFYVTCLLLIQLNLVSLQVILGCWFFVALRICHLIIHTGKNSVKWRMRVYLVQWIALISIWIAILQFFS